MPQLQNPEVCDIAFKNMLIFNVWFYTLAQKISFLQILN